MKKSSVFMRKIDMESGLFLLGLSVCLQTLLFCLPYVAAGPPDPLKPAVPSPSKSVEKDLMRTLLNRYQYYGVVGRPVNHSREQMSVRYGLQLIQVLDLDENKQILRTNCWPMYKWNDSFLRWNPADYNNIAAVRIFPDQVWTPDIKLYNFADERLVEHREARIVVFHEGNTLWVPQALFKSTCPIEISYFPFDTQICMLEFGSWTYDESLLDLQWSIPDGQTMTSPFLDFNDYIASNEWITDGENPLIKNMTIEQRLQSDLQARSVRKYRYRNHTDANGKLTVRRYPVLRFVVKLRRNASFYVFILLMPCILLSSLTFVVFWLPPESPAKMLLGMNIFVSFFILLLLLAESTPSAVKNFPLIGSYFCLNMIMITMSTFFATIVMNLYFRGDRNGPLPKILRRFIVEGIGRLLLVRQYVPLPIEKKMSNHVIARSSQGRVRLRVHVPKLESNKFIISDIGDNPPTAAGGGLGLSPGVSRGGASNQQWTGIGEDGKSGRGGSQWQQQHAGALSSDSDTNPWTPQRSTQKQDRHSSQVIEGEESSISNMQTPGGRGSLMTSSYHKYAPALVDAEDSPLLMRSESSLEKHLREMKRYVRIFVNRQKEHDRKNLLSMEWRTLAMVLDRLFFFLYVMSIVVAAIICIPSAVEPELPDFLVGDDPVDTPMPSPVST